MEKIRTILVDDHLLFTQGLERLLNESGDFNILSKFTDGKSVLDYLQDHSVDLVILDIEMPKMNGLDVAKRIHSFTPETRVVFLSMHEDNVYAREAIALGSAGLLNKSMESNLLIDSLKKVMNGENVFPQVASRPAEDSTLSEREKTILKLMARGMTSEEISGQLRISPLTVKSHRKNMLHKLKAKNAGELLVKAFERGII